MVTYPSSIVNARLQTVFDAVDGAGAGQAVVFDATNNPLITFTLQQPSASIANRVATLNSVVAVASLDGTPAAAQLLNGVGSVCATLNVPADISISPSDVTAGTLASLVGQIVGN